MTDDRSERLRRRRKRTAETASRADSNGAGGSGTAARDPSADIESSDAGGRVGVDDEAENGSGAEAETETEATGNGDATTSIKEEQTGTYMYLPESQTEELRRLYNVLKAEYEFEYGEEFEKNRHFYPLVVQYGLETLDGMDASGIRDRLEEL